MNSNKIYSKLRIIGEERLIKELRKIDDIIDVEKVAKYCLKAMENTKREESITGAVYYASFRYLYEEVDNINKIIDKFTNIRNKLFNTYSFESEVDMVRVIVCVADDVDKNIWKTAGVYGLGDRLKKGLLEYKIEMVDGKNRLSNGFEYDMFTLSKDFDICFINKYNEVYRLDFSKYEKLDKILKEIKRRYVNNE